MLAYSQTWPPWFLQLLVRDLSMVDVDSIVQSFSVVIKTATAFAS
jgi:hypothetical protein